MIQSASKFLVKENVTINDALKKINKTGEKFLICVDKNNKFLGILSDGDLRRAILKKNSLKEKIKSFVNKKATFVSDQVDFNTAISLINSRISILPVIKSSGEVRGFFSYKQKLLNANIKNKKVLIIGLGYVGLTLSMRLSEEGFEVYGYDKNKKLIRSLKSRKIPFYERGLQKFINLHVGKNFLPINVIKKNLDTSVIIISVGTNLMKGKKVPNLKDIDNVTKEIGKILKPNNLVILRSTLPVGVSSSLIKRNLENYSNLTCGKDFYLSFCPERTIEGNALEELKTNPQIVGGYDEISAELSMQFFNSFNSSTIKVKNLEHAELCKLIDNSFRDHKFSFINQFLEFCERTKINLYDVVKAVNYGYSRNNVPIPSPGVGGTCLTKDPYIIRQNFKKLKIKNNLFDNVRKINKSATSHLFNILKKKLKYVGKDLNKSKIFLIGMAFKGYPETSDLRESTSIDFYKMLPKKSNIYVYDPVISFKELNKYNFKTLSLESGFKKCDVVVFLNNHKSYASLDLDKFILKRKKIILLDAWKNFNPNELKKISHIIYGGLGID